MGLKGLIIATVLIFSLAVYAIAAFPAVSLMYDQMHTDKVDEQGHGDSAVFVRDTAIIYVPTMFAIGILLYAYAAIQKEESFFGSGPPR